MSCRRRSSFHWRWLTCTCIVAVAACDTTCKVSACIDELTVTVASMTHQRFAAGHYDIASDGDAVSFRLTCDITSDGGTCKNDGSTTATLRETGDEILIEVPSAPRTLNVSVSKDGTELVRTELLPSYATTTSCTGSCQSASSRIVVPE